ncbi:threonine ammonia-lyase, biosynthetic [Ferrovum sp.]|uniref:threonine ammonia-lyase, biosynthetic n=1 Tax=Ferrovum sp. TaxID=2609467 RepID=UPI0026150F84|nr:threonine ammonia-lyase, biosynthetic [Ferrovum sp.]
MSEENFMTDRYLERILRAGRVYDVAMESPLQRLPRLSARLDNELWLKREDLQPVFSFKLRGAYNKMASLSPETLARGVIAASAGNHAQGVALAAQRMGVRALIVMPVTAPRIKVEAVQALGGEVVLEGVSYSEAYEHALTLVEKEGLTFVHPYDDPEVIAGQGTIGQEILRQHAAPLEAIFVPIGGGGLIAGVAALVKQLRPEIRIIGVQPQDSDAMRQSLAAGRRVVLDQVGLFADGVAVRQVGQETFRLCQKYVDEVVTVDTDALCAAVKDVFDDTRAVLEPAGALAVAGLKQVAQRAEWRGKSVIAIASGANLNFDRLRFVAERAELGEQREGLFAATIPERPGSFRQFCALLGSRAVTEFNYRYADHQQAHVFVGVSLTQPDELPELLNRLHGQGIRTLDLTHNEMAKLHVRHLVGGHAPQAEHEILYRFEFPERPGALACFLERLSAHWNISLFHYRNHGADYGRVLVGLQVPPSDQEDFRNFLNILGYPWVDETRNSAYQLFLGGGA